ncbi:hypothetical protein HK102_009520 [Quaeritorhiza haematococci]|nr:hypothetical protein HK102_009520 [Quaeritorhiza haematococci]
MEVCKVIRRSFVVRISQFDVERLLVAVAVMSKKQCAFDTNPGRGSRSSPLHGAPRFVASGLSVENILAMLRDVLLPLLTDWSIQDLFAKSLDNRCPLATDTQLAVILPKSNGLAFGVQPHGLKHDKDEEGNDVEVGTYRWELLNSDMASRLGISGAADLKFQSRSAFHAHRFVTGYGQERGGITVTLANRQANSSVQALLYQPIPWFMKMYMHTLRITNPNGEVTVRDMHFRPAVDRSHSNVMELHLELPPHSVSEISIDFDKAFIKYTEHPPDANRGFDVGSAVVFVLGANDTERDTANTCDFMKANCRKYYTETLLISLPTPDFSMPYNVITLTCTLLALLFGSMFNLMTRNFTQISIKNQK